MFADPQENVKHLYLTEGMHVADLGAGSGAYSLAAAALVGASGSVYAVEVQKDMLAHIQAEAAKAGRKNIEVLWGNIERPGGTKLADLSMDAVIVSNVLFQAADKAGLAREVARIAKPGARILVVDWSDSFGGMGPIPGHLVAKDDARSLIEGAGLSFVSEIGAGAHHYGLLFKK